MTVVLASAGYPASARTGDEITGAAGLIHAGTARDADGVLRSAGGRVLCATATGHDLHAARAAAYELVSHVELAGGAVPHRHRPGRRGRPRRLPLALTPRRSGSPASAAAVQPGTAHRIDS